MGTTNVTGDDGDDTFLIKTVSGHTTIESGFGNDKITVRNDEGTVDQIAALLTIDTGGGTDVVNVDDAADTNDNTGILTGSTLTGLDMPTVAADAGHLRSTPRAAATGSSAPTRTRSSSSTSTRRPIRSRPRCARCSARRT